MRSAPRALVVLPSLERGGAERVASLLCLELASRGWEVDVYAMCRGEKSLSKTLAENERVHVYARNFKRELYSIVPALYFLLRRREAEQYEVCYSTHFHVNAMVGLMKKLGVFSPKKLVFRESTVVFSRFHGWRRVLFYLLYRLGYGSQDMLIFQTNAMQTSFSAALPQKLLQNSVVIKNPVIVGTDAENSNGALFDPKRNVTKRIVACGRLVSLKGFATLIKAFGSVPELDRSTWSLEIVGGGPDSQHLQNTIDSLGLSDSVHLVGSIEDPESVLRGAEVGIISSLKEGFPNVLLEMMASGVKRIVTTPCFGGHDEIDGLFVSEGFEPEQISAALEAAIRDSGDLRGTYNNYLRAHHSLADFTDAVIE